MDAGSDGPLLCDLASTSHPAPPGFSTNQARRTPPPFDPERQSPGPSAAHGAGTTGLARGDRGARMTTCSSSWARFPDWNPHWPPDGRAPIRLLSGPGERIKACSGTRVFGGGARSEWVEVGGLGLEGHRGCLIPGRRPAGPTVASSSGASGAKPHPDASCPSRPTTTTAMDHRPQRREARAHIKEQGARDTRGERWTATASRAGTRS